MESTKLSFAKVATVDSTGLEVGRIYFETGTGLIKVAKSATEVDAFGGVREAKWDNAKQQLIITNTNGDKIELDLSDVASAGEVSTAIAGKLNIGFSTDASTVVSYYGLKKYTDDAKTAAINSANSHTNSSIGEVNTTIGALTKRVSTAETKLSGIETGAQVNKIEKVSVNGVALPISEKGVNVIVPAATVTGVKTGDKIISLANKELSSTLTIDYDSVNKKIQLKGIGGTVISSIDATNFIKDGMVEKVQFNPTSKKLTITFNTISGKEPIDVDLTSLVDTYTAGNGISISGNSIAINTTVVATKTDVNNVDTKLGAGFSSSNTVATQLAAVKATADAAQTSAQVSTAITTAIEKLDSTDSAVAKNFVTAVSQTNGVVSVTRKALTADDIPAIPANKVTGLTGNVIPVGGSGTHKESKIDAAVEDLYSKVASAAASGVTSFGGKTGAITLKPTVQTNGSINLAISEGKELSASIVGLGSAAYQASTAFDSAGAAEKAKNAAITAAASDATTKADNAKNSAISTASTDATNKANTAETNAKKYADNLWVWATFE